MGGMENGLVNLINRIPPDRYRHSIICIEDFSDFRNRIEDPDVPVIAMGRSKTGTVGLYRNILATLRQLRPAIVHSRNLSGLDALLPALAAGVRNRIHGEHGWDVNDLAGANRKLRLLRRLHSPLIHRYVTVSKDLAIYLERQIGIAAPRITQIYNGVDTEKFEPAASKPPGVMPDAFYGPDQLVIGTVGRLQPVKDQVLLVRAFARLLRDSPGLRPRVRLAIIGDGPLRATLRDCIAAEGVTDATWLPGARDDVARLYQCLDVFVLPSLREGISNTLLEAMATGLPVIATSVGGNVELVEHDRTGQLIGVSDSGALASAMDRYASDEGLRMRHGKSSRQRVVDHFSIDSMVAAYLRMYDRQCGRKG